MYKEIYDGISKLIDKREPSNINNQEIKNLLENFRISFKTTDDGMLKKAIFIPIEKFTNILLISGISPKGDDESRFAKIIMFKGEPCKLVWFNEKGLTSNDLASVVFMVIQQTFSATNTIAENFTKLYNLEKAAHLALVSYYAPMVISIAVLREKYQWSEDMKTYILAMLRIIYNHKDIPMTTVNFIADMIDNDSIYNLLDNGSIYNLQDTYDQEAFWFASKKEEKQEETAEENTEEVKADETVQN